jgi:ribosomal protein RSM22 (predicted rRNA methylase)
MQLPAELERHILKTIGLDNFHAANARIFREKLYKLITELRNLSENYHSANAGSDGFMDSYFAYNFPQNFIKAAYIGNKLIDRMPEIFRNKRAINVLDAGCGEGAGMYGLYHALSSNKTGGRYCLTGIDVSKSMLTRSATLGNLISKKNNDCAVEHKQADINADIFKTLSASSQRYDIIVFSNSLIEIIKTKMLSLSFDKAFACMTDRGALVVIEPALKDCARRLMGLRNIIARDAKYRVVLPCSHNDGCPLLAVEDREEWCHFSVPWQPPEYLLNLNQGLNREIDMLKFSCLVLSKPAPKDAMPSGHVVISRLIHEKGKRKLFLCTPAGRVEVYRQDKEKSKSNQLFDSIISGDTIAIEKHVEKRPNLWRIEKMSKVRVLD